MLKRYASNDRMQWVGRAWEIRRALQQEMKKSGGKARLKELLDGAKKSAVPCLPCTKRPELLEKID